MPPKHLSKTSVQRLLKPRPRLFHTIPHLRQIEPSNSPSIAPKVNIDIKHIRQNPFLHEQNCLSRNYKAFAPYPVRINELYDEYHACQGEGKGLRERNNAVKSKLASAKGEERETLLVEARELKEKITKIQEREDSIMRRIESMAASLPNLTSDETPIGTEPQVVAHYNNHPETSRPGRKWRSHVDIGRELNLLDFSSAATTSGWGFYYLLNEAVLLEQALIQYSLSVARKAGWELTSPPSMVYSHVAAACGFQPRDQNGESQIYGIQQSAQDVGRKPELSLAGTAEIPLAGMKANSVMQEGDFPVKKVGASRCYRAEAGARGADTKGLYRVHEFTKVEMFAWTLPDAAASTTIFDEMLEIQIKILKSLGLHFRVLEMPSTDLGASASRKRDIEAFFPGRKDVDHGWGEVTSLSTCTDYQSRRLGTKLKRGGEGKMGFPYTVNGTALAVPRVLAALLENGWDEGRKEVRIPGALYPWMHGIRVLKKPEM